MQLEAPSIVWRIPSERTSGSQSPHTIRNICLKKISYFSLLGLASPALLIRLLFWMFLCVRIKTKGGERETHTNNALSKTTELYWHFHLPVTFLEDLHFLSLSLSCIWKRLKASVPSPPPYQERTKSILPKAQQKALGFNHKHEYLKLQKFPQHSAFSTQLVFLQQSLLQALGETQL